MLHKDCDADTDAANLHNNVWCLNFIQFQSAITKSSNQIPMQLLQSGVRTDRDLQFYYCHMTTFF